MANKTTPEASPANKTGPGRPSTSESTGPERQEAALAAIVARTDQATARICDHPTTSILSAVAQCARAQVPQEKVDACFNAVEAALKDARQNVARIYAAPTQRVGVASRVSL